MTPSFDPYHKWLGIPPDEQPPNHYRLLGVRLFESDADVISNAADRQMSHIKGHANGQHAAQSQKILNELAAAKVCLLKSVAKTAYDAELKARLNPASATGSATPTPLPVATPMRQAMATSAPSRQEPVATPKTTVVRDHTPSTRIPRAKQQNPIAWLAGVAAVTVTLLLGFIAYRTSSRSSHGLESQAIAQTNTRNATNTSSPKVEKPVATTPPAIKRPSTPSIEPEKTTASATIDAEREPAQVSSTVSPDKTVDEADITDPTNEPAPSEATPTDATPERSESETPKADEDDDDDEPLGPPTESTDTTTEKPAKRLPVPNDADLRAATKAVSELLADDPPNASAADLVASAEKLLALAEETTDDPTSQFALFTKARELAVKASDVALSVKTVEHIAQHFEVNVFDEQADSLEKILTAERRRPQAQQSCAKLATLALDLARTAIDQDAIDDALRLSQVGQGAAQVSKSRDLIKRATATTTECKALQKAQAGQAAALRVLATDADHQEANFTVGRYLCFVRGKWESGLPHLAKCATESLRSAAELDLSVPTTAGDRAKCGDLWWDLSLKANGKEKESLQKRAAFWYQQAVVGLKGLERARAEKRIGELAVASPVLPADLLQAARLSGAVGEEHWIENGKVLQVSGDDAEVRLPVTFPPQYELVLDVRKPDRGDGHFVINLETGKQPIYVLFDGIDQGRRHCKVGFGDETQMIDAHALGHDRPHQIRIIVKQHDIAVAVDNKPLLALTTKSDLAPAAAAQGDAPHRIDLRVRKAKVEVGRLQVLPVKGR